MKLTKPLVFIDLETTGKFPSIDRIVEISTIKLNPDGTEIAKTVRVNPSIPIRKGAFEVHGISDQDVANEPTFSQYAKSFFEFIEGCDLAGYNLLRFDLRILQKEFKRCGLELDTANKNLIDPMVIFHNQEPRDLNAAYEKYCGKPLEKAHKAEEDAQAAKEILLNQIKSHPEIGKTMEELHSYCHPVDPDAIDPTGFLINSHLGPQFTRGKHEEKFLSEIANSDLGYLKWLIEKKDTDPKVIEAINQFI